MDLDARLRERLAALHHAGLDRALPPVRERRGVTYRLGDRRVVGFCSNDYLGLADQVVARQAHPTGSAASRLICGDLDVHRDLEAALARLTGMPAAVVFPSGFQANVGALPALVEPGDRVFSDRLNHASLIDGLRLARASTTVLPHGRPPPADAHTSASSPPHWWVVESIYSMDGDRVPHDSVQSFIDAGGLAYVDEAHALGLFDRGAGLLGAHGIAPTVMVGTLSKAFGCAGAFVAASQTACHWLRTRARSFVFSTGISPLLAEALLEAIARVTGSEGDARRTRLWSNCRRLLEQLDLQDHQASPPSPIVPILVGDNAKAVELATALLDRGWHVQPIRPPTVPQGTARLRITLTAQHEPEQIDRFAADLRELLHTHAIPLQVRRGLDRPGQAT